jgi:hypothetical protein
MEIFARLGLLCINKMDSSLLALSITGDRQQQPDPKEHTFLPHLKLSEANMKFSTAFSVIALAGSVVAAPVSTPRTDGRCGYNGGLSTDGRSGYNGGISTESKRFSIEGTDGRSGYNGGISSDGRSGYNGGLSTDGRSGYNGGIATEGTKEKRKCWWAYNWGSAC